MSAVAASQWMTTEELLALPDDGKRRWLIRGKLREKEMTKRNRFRSRILSRIDQLLGNWVDQQPRPRGEVLADEVGCRLRRDPDTTVGVDVVYISPELAAHDPDDTSLVDGAPILAVEILSPNDTVEEITERIQEFLTAGVALLWVVDPYQQTVTVHRPGAAPVLYNVEQELAAEPHLPGFRVPVAKIFSR